VLEPTVGLTSLSARRIPGSTASNKNLIGKTYTLVLGITAKMIADLGIPIYNQVVSGSGTTFTLAHMPVSTRVRLYAGGNSNPQTGRLAPGSWNDYTISGATITDAQWKFCGASILADYAY
jgi:hypothetical protein